jgi:hypothetical protein
MGRTSKNGGSRVSGSASSALPGRKLVTSTTPRMLKPFEIDLLRQDLQVALQLLGQNEIDDAHALMRDQGFRPDDFEIFRHADPSPAFASAVTGKVTLVRKSTQVAKNYEAGVGHSWLRLFENDLKEGAFGRTRARAKATG